MDVTPQRPSPYFPSPALAHAVAARRPANPWSQLLHFPHVLLFLTAFVAFLISAGALVAPQVTGVFHHFSAPPTQSAPAASALSAGDLQAVLSYAQQMRAEDTLVQVRPGVFAKRSNVEGVAVGGRTIYYDLVPDQSYGPLRTGRVDESQVDVLGRYNGGNTLVVVYALR
jgi:hypothetical protein